jgi:hypothetical protein
MKRTPIPKAAIDNKGSPGPGSCAEVTQRREKTTTDKDHLQQNLEVGKREHFSHSFYTLKN